MIELFQSTLTTQELSNLLKSPPAERNNSPTSTEAQQFSQALKTNLGSTLSTSKKTGDAASSSSDTPTSPYQSTLSMYTSGPSGKKQTTATETAHPKMGTATSPNTPSNVTLLKADQADAKLGADAANTTPTASANPAVVTPFTNLDEFKAWENSLGNTFAADYKAPDYVHMMGLSLGGGESDAFKRYLFFKNNPQYVADFQAIHQGERSKFPTDGSTLHNRENYRMAKYGEGTGQIIDFDGTIYDPTTGQKAGQASAPVLAALYTSRVSTTQYAA